MRSVLVILTALLVTSGIVSANLWRDLGAERRLNADLHTQLTEAKHMLSRVASPAGPLVAADIPPVITAGAVPDTRTIETPPAGVRPPLRAPAGVNQGRDPLLNSEYRSARLAEQRMSIQRTLPGLVEELGLSEEDAGRLFDLLAESRVNRESAASLSIGADGQPNRQESLRRQQELRRQEQESIAALLGTTRYAQWQQYQQTLLARMDANTKGAQLAQMGQPLSSAQQKSLTTALIAEQERTREDRERLARRDNPADPQAMAQLQEEAMKLQEESNRRILEAVGSSLDARQLETLREQFEVRAAMQRAASGLQ
jgi:hypothetical protein